MPQEHEIRTVTTLRNKRVEIERAIKGYKRSLEQARADLVHINAAIVIFEAKTPGEAMKPYDGIKRLFRDGEPVTLCEAALQAAPLTTRGVAVTVMEAKGLNLQDRVLARAIACRLNNTLKTQWRMGRLASLGKRAGVTVLARPDLTNREIGPALEA